MNLVSLLVITTSILLSATSQILLKWGMVSPSVRAAIDKGLPLDVGIAVATSPGVLLGFTCFGVSTLMWLGVLARTPLSTAYPFVSLGIAITVFAGAWLFGEQLSWQKLAGVALILAGILTVANA